MIIILIIFATFTYFFFILGLNIQVELNVLHFVCTTVHTFFSRGGKLDTCENLQPSDCDA